MTQQQLDPAVARALSLGPDTTASVSRHGGSGFSTTAKITATTLADGDADGAGEPQQNKKKDFFFMKTAVGSDAEIMFRGEHASLNAIHAVVPSLCPQSFGHGVLEEKVQRSSSTAFLVTDYLDLGARAGAAASGGAKGPGSSSGLSLAAKLGKLHTTPAPIPPGFATPVFGFPVPTCCGDTLQANDYQESWAEFYANNRLRAIIRQYEHAQGKDAELRSLVENVADTIVPRLLRDGHHTDNGRKITPVVVHGDLWSGNRGKGVIGGRGGLEEVVFDPSACYASREYEWGIMSMFGGFDREFEEEYHTICPKMEPVEEYNDRIRLYELYHHLNHATIFGNSYRSGAVSIMRELQQSEKESFIIFAFELTGFFRLCDRTYITIQPQPSSSHTFDILGRLVKEQGDDKEEDLLIAGWNDVACHHSSAQTDGFKEFALIRELMKDAHTKYAERLEV